MDIDKEKIEGEIRDSVALQVGAKLKENYENLRMLLATGQEPIEIVPAEKMADEEFKQMALLAMQKRALFFKTPDSSREGYKQIEVSLEDINQKFHSVPEEAKTKMGMGNFNINSMIPELATITKTAGVIADSGKKAKDSEFSIGFSAIISFIGSLISSFFNKDQKSLSWAEAKAQAGSEHTQKIANEGLVKLADSDILAHNFLNQRTEKDQPMVQELIIGAIPEKVYEGLGVTVPDNLKPKAPEDLIKNAKVAPAPTVDINENILELRKIVLYPKDKPPLEEQITQQILGESNKQLAEARQVYNDTPLTNLIEKPKAYSKLKITEQLALQEGDANKMGEVLAHIVANGFEHAVKDPKFKTLKTQEEMAEFIAQKVTEELDAKKNHEHLTIVKTIEDDVVNKGINLAEYVSGKSDYAKKFIAIEMEKLPPRVGENQYAVVNIDKVKPDIIAGIHKNIDHKAFKNLQFLASVIPAKEQKLAQAEPPSHRNPVFTEAKEKCKTHLGAVTECSDIIVPVKLTAQNTTTGSPIPTH